MGKSRTATDLLAADEARALRVDGLRAREKRSGIKQPSAELLAALSGGVVAASGAAVTETSASTVPTFLACVGMLSDMLGALPCKLYRKTADGREEQSDHPAHGLISTMPGELHTSFELRRLAQAGCGFGGNGYIRVWRDSFFQPGELQWLRPIDVRPELWKMPDGRRRVRYQVDGVKGLLSRTDIVHVQALSTDGLVGISPLRALRESLGLSLTQRQQAGKIYANGARFPGFLTAPPTLTKPQVDDSRKEWTEKQAGAENAGKTPILWGGWSYTATNGMSMQDAEFLESRKFERSEIATLFRLPEVLLGNSDKASSWGTGIETLTNGFLALTLNPWLVNWEQSLAFTLLTEEERRAGFYFRFTREALLQIAKEAQAKFFREMRDIGVYSVNDVRAKLEENDLPDAIGDNYRLPFNGSGGTPAATQNAPEPTSTR